MAKELQRMKFQSMMTLALVEIARSEAPYVAVHYVQPGESAFAFPLVWPDLYYPMIGFPYMANPYNMMADMSDSF